MKVFYMLLTHILELQKEKGELTDKCRELQKEKGELTDKCRELQKKVDNLQSYLDTKNCYRECAETWSKLTDAKELIRNIIRVIWGEGWNYSLDWKVKAEQFLKETKHD